MRREDDFAQRRAHIANLTDEELYDRFWELTAQVVDPLLELGTPIFYLHMKMPDMALHRTVNLIHVS